MKLKLGLIGRSISKSRSPALHRMLGEIYGFDVSYDLKDPGLDSEDAFAKTLTEVKQEGFTGCNVTFPFKALATKYIDTPDAAVIEVGSANTLYLANETVTATNTDFTGFINGYQHRRGEQAAGEVLLIGAGGVGRAVAFGLFNVGATKVFIYDLNKTGAQNLADSLMARGYEAEVVDQNELATITKQVNGLVNCTPIGHYSTPGNPLSPELFGGQEWAFDAVYTPIDTEFMTAAHKAGLDLVSGFDLFFYQGINAFAVFAGIEVDPALARTRFINAFDVQSELLQLS